MGAWANRLSMTNSTRFILRSRGTHRARDRNPASVCNLYSVTKGPQATRDLTNAMRATSATCRRCRASFRTILRRSSATAPKAVSWSWRAGACRRPRGSQRQESRSGSDEHPQRLLAPLAMMARRREPLRRAVHVLLGERGLSRRLPGARVVRLRQKPLPGLFRRPLDALDVSPEGQGRRDDKRRSTASSRPRRTPR